MFKKPSTPPPPPHHGILAYPPPPPHMALHAYKDQERETTQGGVTMGEEEIPNQINLVVFVLFAVWGEMRLNVYQNS